MGKCEQCIVRQLSSLKTLSKEELLKVSATKMSRSVRKGELIFEEGEHVNGVFCVKDGVCKLTKLSSNGRDQIVKLVSKGELLGQRSMLSDEPANLSAFALDDMEVCFIPKAEMLDIFKNNNKFSMSLMQNICGDLRVADNLMVGMAQKSVKERLAHIILYLADTFGVDADHYLNLQLSREEFSGMIGTAVESCIRILSELNKTQVIEIAGKKIRIIDREKLQRISGDK